MSDPCGYDTCDWQTNCVIMAECFRDDLHLDHISFIMYIVPCKAIDILTSSGNAAPEPKISLKVYYTLWLELKREPLWGSGGGAPSGVQGGQGALPPEADNILTFCVHFSELNCTQIYCFMLLITI